MERKHLKYETLTLPTKGECYSHKKGRIDVAYLTAADEDMIFNESLRREGRMSDVLLERKIVDKVFNASELCTSDREYILLWLRISGYGKEFHLRGHEGVATIDLSNIKFKEFNYFGDENGHFDYVTGKGDNIKYHLLTRSEEREFMDLQNNPEHRKDENGAIRLIRTLLSLTTVSVNGNNNRDSVATWIDGLSEVELMKYLRFYMNNNAGVDSHTDHGIELGDELFSDLTITSSTLYRE